MILKGYLLSLAYGVLCLALAFLVYKLGVPKQYTRKIVHILVGFEWLILYTFFGAAWHFLLVCLLFTALLVFVYFKKLTPMMSSDGDNAPGTVWYGVAMSIMATVSLFIPDFVLFFGIGVFCTSLGDGFAGLVGQSIKKYNPKIYGNKTLFGFLTNFLVSSLVPLVFEWVFDMGLEVWHCLIIGFFSACVEIISVFGLDNITVTLGTAFLSFMFIYLPTYRFYLAPIILTPVVIALVLKKKALTPFATVLAVALDIVVSLTLGNFGFVLLLSFLFGSVIIDKIKKKKLLDDGITKKGDCRDSVQVIANGLIPMVMALLFSISLERAFIVAYVAALAEAFSDTAASGFGVFSQKTFDLFKWRKCERGISGGISLAGSIAALASAFVIPLIALAFGAVDLPLMLLSALIAFLGVVFDSLLGSLVQIKYKCSVCGKITERELHCGKRTKKFSGFEFFDNDVVNLLSGAFSAVLACAVCL